MSEVSDCAKKSYAPQAGKFLSRGRTGQDQRLDLISARWRVATSAAPQASYLLSAVSSALAVARGVEPRSGDLARIGARVSSQFFPGQVTARFVTALLATASASRRVA